MALLPAAARLYTAGTGPLESELRQRAAALGIQERVRFLGFVDNLVPWMQAADGVVLASRWVGLPLVLLEAAACGLPAVATDVDGSREVVVPGSTGVLCAPGDPAEMAAAMQYIMRLPVAERAAMGMRAREQAVAEFSLTQVLDRWEALYGDLLGRHSRFPRHAQSPAVPLTAIAARASAEVPVARETTPPNLADVE